MAERRQIQLCVGAFGPTLHEQLEAQGLALAAHDLEHFEKDRKALGRLGVRGILSEGERDKAAMRLLKNIAQKCTAAKDRANG
jgi:hypothetical protein